MIYVILYLNFVLANSMNKWHATMDDKEYMTHYLFDVFGNEHDVNATASE